MNKFVIAALAALIALPAAAQDMNPGKIELARSLGLDPNKYTLNELAQINDQYTPAERAARLRYINEMKARGRTIQPQPQATPRRQSRFLSQRQGIGRNDY